MTTRKTISKNLIEIIADYPDQLQVIIDELTFKLDQNQLDQIEDLIVNNYNNDEV
tara:strand:- start:754 stop:918 length:165 start_codon:yes stop_codon:yes gene_type:complete